MKRTHGTLAVIPLLSTVCLAQDSFATRIDDYIRGEMQSQQIPGVALAVVEGGKVMLARGYGLAKYRTPDTGKTRGDLSVGLNWQAVYSYDGDAACGSGKVESKRQDDAITIWQTVPY